MQLQKASTACRRRGECGQSTVEFAVVAAAFLAVTLLCVTEIGNALRRSGSREARKL